MTTAWHGALQLLHEPVFDCLIESFDKSLSGCWLFGYLVPGGLVPVLFVCLLGHRLTRIVFKGCMRLMYMCLIDSLIGCLYDCLVVCFILFGWLFGFVLFCFV